MAGRLFTRTPFHLVFSVAVASALTLTSPAPCRAAPMYSITELTSLGAGATPYAMNNAGAIVGAIQAMTPDHQPTDHAFLYDGIVHDIGALQPGSSVAYDINDCGQVVGAANDRAFLYDGAMHEVGGGIESFARGINSSGVVVGAYRPDLEFGVRAFYYDGSLHDLGNFGGSGTQDMFCAYAINDTGQIAGCSILGSIAGFPEQAFLYDGTLHSLNALSDNRCSWAFAINNPGKVVGMVTAPVSCSAFLYDGTMHDLGTLDGSSSAASGINNSNQVIGISGSRPFVYTGAGPMQDLNNLIPKTAGATLWNANAINDKGQIVCQGTNTQGENRVYLLTPLSTITATTDAPPNTLSCALKPVAPNLKPPSGNLRRWNGTSWDPVDKWTDNGIDLAQPTVVLVHGWDGDVNGVAGLARSLYNENQHANILGWDWSDQAKIKSPPKEDDKSWLEDAADCATRGFFMGIPLANEISNLHIDASTLQLIGHSNGGAVIGSAASRLARDGQKVRRVTTLDSPNLLVSEVSQVVAMATGNFRVNAMQYVHPESAAQVEVYYSGSPDNRKGFGFGAPLETGMSNVFNGKMYQSNAQFYDKASWDHMQVLNWYAADRSGATLDPGQFVAAIDWSIVGPHADQFVAVDAAEQSDKRGVFQTTSISLPASIQLAKQVIEGFDTGTSWKGQHAEIAMRDASNAAARITSGSDGYLWSDISVPKNAYYLTFDLKVETPGVGDFLTVTLGDELLYYQPLDSADSDFWTVDPIFVGNHSGKTETILFTLNHVGLDTPTLLLDDISFEIVPEPSAIVLLATGLAGLVLYRMRGSWRAYRPSNDAHNGP